MTQRGTEEQKSRSALIHIERTAAFCAAISVLGMMLVGAVDVIGTAAFATPLQGAYELTEALMVASIFLALALSQRFFLATRVAAAQAFFTKQALRARLTPSIRQSIS